MKSVKPEQEAEARASKRCVRQSCPPACRRNRNHIDVKSHTHAWHSLDIRPPTVVLIYTRHRTLESITVPLQRRTISSTCLLHTYCLLRLVSVSLAELMGRVEITSRHAMRGSFSPSRWSSVLPTVLLKPCCFTLLHRRSISVPTRQQGQFRLICPFIFSLCIFPCRQAV